MHIAAIISSLLLVISFFLPWWHESAAMSYKGYNNPEGYVILIAAVTTGLAALYNLVKKKMKFAGIYFPAGVAGVTIAVLFYLSIKNSGNTNASFDTGLYIAAAASALLVIAGLFVYFKAPKELVYGLAGLVLFGAGSFVYKKVMTEEYADTKSGKADYTVDALPFIKSFESGDSSVNKKYREKIIVVRGRISEVEEVDSSTINIKFIDTINGSYINFAFQQQSLGEAKDLKEGDSVAIKGSCDGGEHSDILNVTAITFKRSTLDKKY
jgi:tRNA_anti-like